MIRHFLIALVLPLSLGLVACGGGSKEAAQPTPEAQSTPAATPTPMNTPVITDNLFEYKDRGYSVRFPEGWTPMPNFLSTADYSVDAFFAPQEQEVQQVHPNMAVTCQSPSEGTTPKDYFDKEVNIVKSVTKVDPETSSREVSGQEALQIRYTRENTDSPLEKTEVLLVTDRCNWNISVTAPYSSRDSYYEPFDQFVDSFRLLP